MEPNTRKIKQELLKNLFDTMSKVQASRYKPAKKEQPIKEDDEGGLEIEVMASGKTAEDLKDRVERLKKHMMSREE